METDFDIEIDKIILHSFLWLVINVNLRAKKLRVLFAKRDELVNHVV